MKLFKALVALLVVAGLVVPAVAIAEDRLSLSGEMRVRGWHKDFDYDGDDDDSTSTWADQRLRIAGKIAVAEGVSITFRTDITEANWGSNNSTFGAGRGGSTQQWDRAHIDLTKGMVHVRAGQQLTYWSQTGVIDNQTTGISFDLATGVPVSGFVYLNEDNDAGVNSTTGTILDPAADAFVSGLKVSPKGDNWKAEFIVGNQNKLANADENVMVYAANVAFNLDAFKIAAELDVFDGDANDTDDAYGTQFMADGSFALSDAATLGAQFFYGAGDDEDVQYTYLGNRFNGWDPIFDIGNSLSNEQIVGGSPFNVATVGIYEGGDITLSSMGAIGGRLYGMFKANDDLSFGASAGYFQEEEDALASLDYYALAGGVVYKLMANTTLQLQLQYTDGNVECNTGICDGQDADFDAFEAGTGLFVSF